MSPGYKFIEAIWDMAEEDLRKVQDKPMYHQAFTVGDIVRRPGVHLNVGIVRSIFEIPAPGGNTLIKSVEVLWAATGSELEFATSMEPDEARGILKNISWAPAEMPTGLIIVYKRPQWLEPRPATGVIRNLRAIELE